MGLGASVNGGDGVRTGEGEIDGVIEGVSGGDGVRMGDGLGDGDGENVSGGDGVGGGLGDGDGDTSPASSGQNNQRRCLPCMTYPKPTVKRNTFALFKLNRLSVRMAFSTSRSVVDGCVGVYVSVVVCTNIMSQPTTGTPLIRNRE